ALLDDPARRAALGEAGRRRAQEFTWARSAQRHVEAYERAVGSAAA
ncbi:MAG: glycosyltransferase family 1 protein, partial [Actinomycetota bacterium]|nr:glycosyltransferase family 1 protein [Actinomycetota bacterium]